MWIFTWVYRSLFVDVALTTFKMLFLILCVSNLWVLRSSDLCLWIFRFWPLIFWLISFGSLKFELGYKFLSCWLYVSGFWVYEVQIREFCVHGFWFAGFWFLLDFKFYVLWLELLIINFEVEDQNYAMTSEIFFQFWTIFEFELRNASQSNFFSNINCPLKIFDSHGDQIILFYLYREYIIIISLFISMKSNFSSV